MPKELSAANARCSWIAGDFKSEIPLIHLAKLQSKAFSASLSIQSVSL